MIQRIGVLILCCVSFVAYSKAVEMKVTSSEFRVSKQWGLGVSSGFLTGNGAYPFDASRSGFGPLVRYEFALSPKLDLGILSTYRVFAGTESIHQLSYGLTMSHRLTDIAKNLGLYASYGLMMQMFGVEGNRSSSSAHDTRLAMGLRESSGDQSVFCDLAYHISRLRNIDMDSHNLDYFSLDMGIYL